MTLQDFLTAPVRSAWISEPGIKIFVRKALRGIGDSYGPALDVANVEVEEQQRGRGIFKKWLKTAEELAAPTCRYLYVENVQNPILPSVLYRAGYVPHPLTPDCYIKRL